MTTPTADSHPVLVVEDDADLLETFILVLESSGHAAVGAADGYAALEMLRGGMRPCVILLDLMMPGMNGWQFREQQLKDPALAPIPVVLISAAGPGAEDKTLRPAAFLPKPVDLDALLDTVRRVSR